MVLEQLQGKFESQPRDVGFKIAAIVENCPPISRRGAIMSGGADARAMVVLANVRTTCACHGPLLLSDWIVGLMERWAMTLSLVVADGIARVTLDRPPVNALDLDAIQRLCSVFADLAAEPPQVGLVLAGAGRCFCGGIDTRAFGAYGRTERAQTILAITQMVTKLYSLPFPVVSASGWSCAWWRLRAHALW
jgi:Enoyl-CoA hydratase/isomerase